MAVALHEYLVDDGGKVYGRFTVFAGTEAEAEALLEDDEEPADSFEILEHGIAAPDAASMRTVSEEQGRYGDADEDEEEEDDADEEEEEEDE